MRALLFFGLFLSVLIGVEAFYRWSNALELSWSWLGLRSGMFATIMLASFLGSRWERRRERAGHSDGNSIAWPLFSLVLAGTGSIVWTWTVVDALMTGRIEVSRTPELYTSWSANPWGFAVAMALALLGAMLLLLFTVANILIIWNNVRARHGPAWP